VDYLACLLVALNLLHAGSTPGRLGIIVLLESSKVDLPDGATIWYDIHHNHADASLWRDGEQLSVSRCFYYETLGEVFTGLLVEAGYNPDDASMTIEFVCADNGIDFFLEEN
jgi:hypothetical protein